MFKIFHSHLLSAMLLTASLLLSAGCGKNNDADSKYKIVCSLPPVAYIASQIGGDAITVYNLLPEGKTPHDYSPRPGEIRAASDAALLFTTGMMFEQRIAEALKGKVEIRDVSAGIKRRHLETVHHHDHHHDHHHGHGENCSADSLDPHIWLSHSNAEKIADNICEALCKTYPEQAELFRNNLDNFKKRLADSKAGCLKKLAPYKGRDFYVYHPAFGYFADEFSMKQSPIEINGREISAVQLASVIRQAREHNVKVIFVQPQFNPSTAKELAKKIGGSAAPLDPLAYDLLRNFSSISDAVAAGFVTGGNQ